MTGNRITYRTADGIRVPEGAEASAFGLAGWKFGEPRTWLTPETLVAEIRNTIDRLNGRPDSTGRCLAAGAERRAGGEQARTAVMTRLLRAKFTQHPHLATDDATLVYDDSASEFWGDNGGRGRNWTGRLLELVRSELHAGRSPLR
ncbi:MULTISPECIES: NADAR family protein [Streptomyces]|uniref:NADAR family protein n=1 Tax=Streptomyces fimbriatus TaxID=68197 RepID=A0ABW0D2Y1_STRFI